MEIKNYDTKFIEEDFLSYAANVFVKSFSAIMLGNLNDVDHFLTDEVFEKIKSIREENDKKNQIQMYDELNVKNIEIIDFKIIDNDIEIYVDLDSRYMDYKMDKETKKTISGNDKERIERNYKLVFTKKLSAIKNDFINKCSGCGASMDTNSSGVCPYCGKIFVQEEHDYVLKSINI